MKKNENLKLAKQNKNDEFYTYIEDVEREAYHYTNLFENKNILCNCDNPKHSNFFKYFLNNFDQLKIKSLTASFYSLSEKSYYKRIYKDTGILKEEIHYLSGNGDFRSNEIIGLLKNSDIVITNPPFSLFREYIQQLVNYKKQFLIIGNHNALTTQNVFRLFQNNHTWTGVTKPKRFKAPDGTEKLFGNIIWYTNLTNEVRNSLIPLDKKYSENAEEYDFYENYPAINVNKLKNIPLDYYGPIGVPLTFLEKYNPQQFEIIGLGNSKCGLEAGVQPYKPAHRDYRKNIQKRGTANGDLYFFKDNKVIVPYSRVLIKLKS